MTLTSLLFPQIKPRPPRMRVSGQFWPFWPPKFELDRWLSPILGPWTLTKVKISVAGVCTGSMGVTTPWLFRGGGIKFWLVRPFLVVWWDATWCYFFRGCLQKSLLLLPSALNVYWIQFCLLHKHFMTNKRKISRNSIKNIGQAMAWPAWPAPPPLIIIAWHTELKKQIHSFYVANRHQTCCDW